MAKFLNFSGFSDISENAIRLLNEFYKITGELPANDYVAVGLKINEGGLVYAAYIMERESGKVSKMFINRFPYFEGLCGIIPDNERGGYFLLTGKLEIDENCFC